jgi:hypothetical protein
LGYEKINEKINLLTDKGRKHKEDVYRRESLITKRHKKQRSTVRNLTKELRQGYWNTHTQLFHMTLQYLREWKSKHLNKSNLRKETISNVAE